MSFQGLNVAFVPEVVLEKGRKVESLGNIRCVNWTASPGAQKLPPVVPPRYARMVAPRGFRSVPKGLWSGAMWSMVNLCMQFVDNGTR